MILEQLKEILKDNTIRICLHHKDCEELALSWERYPLYDKYGVMQCFKRE